MARASGGFTSTCRSSSTTWARSDPPAIAIAEALRVHKARPLSPQLEIETYTWDMLPDELKTGDIVEYVCREIEWVRGELVPAARKEPSVAS